jgi:hypothetical protein
MANKTSQHILNTAANLLGFCLFIITSLHFTNKTENKSLDQLSSVIALFLTVSCIFSFISIRTEKIKKEILFEKIAEILFFISLLGIFIIIILLLIKF